jgi:LmbE family N-acetylglucosaminyl deacetylase
MPVALPDDREPMSPGGYDAGAWFGDHVVVVSPHLDDGVFSLGAAVSRASERGGAVKVLTVLACDPTSPAPAGSWDRRCGFATASDAAAARRREDAKACREIGAEPAWLPFGDMTYGRGADDEAIWAEVLPHLRPADAVLVPGFPLTHPDHRWLTRLVLSRVAGPPRLGVYAEQPYAYHLARDEADGARAAAESETGSVVWARLGVGRRHVRSKRRAIAAYRSQLRHLTDRRSLPRALVRAERDAGGEAIAWLTDA